MGHPIGNKLLMCARTTIRHLHSKKKLAHQRRLRGTLLLGLPRCRCSSTRLHRCHTTALFRNITPTIHRCITTPTPFPHTIKLTPGLGENKTALPHDSARRTRALPNTDSGNVEESKSKEQNVEQCKPPSKHSKQRNFLTEQEPQQNGASP